MSEKKRYVHVGTGQRAWMYLTALAGKHADAGTLCAVCDTNRHRMDYWNKYLGEKYHFGPVPTYKAADFDRMIAEQKPDTVIVTSIDRTHHRYICRAMELGCDVITEKPMTIDAEKCQEIIDTRKRTGRKVTVAFNYRYAPRNTKVKEIIRSGLVGTITSVHFEWSLSTSHGADYFRRWHRDKLNSGGLLVHKSTHHFDLVNWWLDTQPETVFAMGALRFYGRINAESRGIDYRYYRTRNVPAAAADPFAYTGPATVFPYAETSAEFFYRRFPQYKDVLGRLFKDPTAALGQRSAYDVFFNLYMFVGGMNSLPENLKFDVSGLFTPDEYATLWETDNYERFREYLKPPQRRGPQPPPSHLP